MCIRRSSLKNYTGNNTRQHDTTRVQYDITRDNTSTTRHNTSTIRQTRVQNDPTEVLRKKLGLYFVLFVIELYIFLISFRNS